MPVNTGRPGHGDIFSRILKFSHFYEQPHFILFVFTSPLLLQEKELEDEVKRMAEEGSIVIVLIALKRC